MARESTPHVAVIVAAAGRGVRLGGATPKQLLLVGGKSLLTRSVEAFVGVPRVREIVVVVPAEHAAAARAHLTGIREPLRVVEGGPRRQDSVALGLAAVPPDADIILVHDAARAFVPREVIERTIDAADRQGAAIAALPARDTVKQGRPGTEGPVVETTLPRDRIFLAQTPQGFRREVLEAAVALGASGVEATDEARLAELAGYDVALVEGDPRSLKVTTEADLPLVLALSAIGSDPEGVARDVRPDAVDRHPRGGTRPVQTAARIGFGYDSHRLVEGRPLILGGVRVPFEKGLVGHSDADAVAHAVTDAVLGGAGLGDIGKFFPDSDPRWKDADSLTLLADAAARVRAAGYRVVNVDVTVIAERPRLAPYRDAMRVNLARVLGIEADAVSVKGKTNEGVDATGRGEAIVAHAVVLLGSTGVQAPVQGRE